MTPVSPVSCIVIEGHHRLLSFASQLEAVTFAADEIVCALEKGIAERGQAHWLGCGGTSPKPIYEQVAAKCTHLSQSHLIVLDERFVPLRDPRSNETLLRGCFPEHYDVVGLMRDEASLENAALLAEQALLSLGGGALPKLDCALMGMGADGHYASIFARHPINVCIYDTTAKVLGIAASGQEGVEPVIARLSLTVPMINGAPKILFYITGEKKLQVLHDMASCTDPYVSPIGAFLAQSKTPVTFVWAP